MNTNDPILMLGGTAILLFVGVVIFALRRWQKDVNDRQDELQFRVEIAQALREKDLESLLNQASFADFAYDAFRLLCVTSVRPFQQNNGRTYNFTLEEFGFYNNGFMRTMLLFFWRWEEFLVGEYKPSEPPTDSVMFLAMIYGLKSELTKFDFDQQMLRFMKTGDGEAEVVSRFEDAHIKLRQRPSPPV